MGTSASAFTHAHRRRPSEGPPDAGACSAEPAGRLPLSPPGQRAGLDRAHRRSRPVSLRAPHRPSQVCSTWDLLKPSQLQCQRHFCLRTQGERAGQAVFCVLNGSSPRSMDPRTCSVSPDGPAPSTALKPKMDWLFPNPP
ncbi:uncharacterized protein LOC129538184 isoform X1 [Moschus berezovskii]|uniref:uncharacterized protein LOC129538184 isoform X1 n=1 Tax=Moschus berezovskii TaxID=68408 RepID=UPI0024441454|nr:uncharacterized protein LOC129538184 isoform X1 [Moschus berezovskii]